MIEFIEQEHLYLVSGVIVPSVSEILHKVFPNKYEGIPQEILLNKANYGTQIHKFIEVICKKKPKNPIAYLKRYYDIDYIQELSIQQFLRICDEYNIEVLENEKMVHYKDLYCGTLDMKAKVNGKLAIIDIKTTAQLDKDYVAWQTSYYELADEPVEELYCLWLPKKHLGKLEKVERIEERELTKYV